MLGRLQENLARVTQAVTAAPAQDGCGRGKPSPCKDCTRVKKKDRVVLRRPEESECREGSLVWTGLLVGILVGAVWIAQDHDLKGG